MDPQSSLSGHIVQMSIMRLLNFLNISKITQVSFAEYHSKRNFVEHVYAKENRVLSKHGPFLSIPLHKTASVGSKEHIQNLESVAKKVRRTIVRGSFGGHRLFCQISLLSWLTPGEVKEYQRKMQDDLEAQINAEKEKNVWKCHTLIPTLSHN